MASGPDRVGWPVVGWPGVGWPGGEELDEVSLDAGGPDVVLGVVHPATTSAADTEAMARERNLIRCSSVPDTAQASRATVSWRRW